MSANECGFAISDDGALYAFDWRRYGEFARRHGARMDMTWKQADKWRKILDLVRDDPSERSGEQKAFAAQFSRDFAILRNDAREAPRPRKHTCNDHERQILRHFAVRFAEEAPRTDGRSAGLIQPLDVQMHTLLELADGFTEDEQGEPAGQFAELLELLLEQVVNHAQAHVPNHRTMCASGCETRRKRLGGAE
jgi:hypothetical protein